MPFAVAIRFNGKVLNKKPPKVRFVGAKYQMREYLREVADYLKFGLQEMFVSQKNG